MRGEWVTSVPTTDSGLGGGSKAPQLPPHGSVGGRHYRRGAPVGGAEPVRSVCARRATLPYGLLVALTSRQLAGATASRQWPELGSVVPDDVLQRHGLTDLSRQFNLAIGYVFQSIDASLSSYVHSEKTLGKSVADIIPKEKAQRLALRAHRSRYTHWPTRMWRLACAAASRFH